MDGRFYVMSLAAIFLALALGILLGVHLPGAEALLVSEERLVAGIEQELARLHEDRSAMRRELDEVNRKREQLQSELEDLLSLAVSDRLDGLQVKVIEPEEDDPAAEQLFQVVELLRLAGADDAARGTVADLIIHTSTVGTGEYETSGASVVVKPDGSLLLTGEQEYGTFDLDAVPRQFQFLQQLRQHLEMPGEYEGADREGFPSMITK